MHGLQSGGDLNEMAVSGSPAGCPAQSMDKLRVCGRSSGATTRQRARKRTAATAVGQQERESEEKRVKSLTEAILYELLPAALNVMLPHTEDPLKELDADRCRAVAAAALSAAALMNAPPGFLEFLLCVPWRKLSQLYPKSDTIDKLISNLSVTEDERRRLVNMRLQPVLLRTVLDFLYKPVHADSVPPLLQLTDKSAAKSTPDTSSPAQVCPVGPSHPAVTLEMVAAMLDGAAPLHCAALRGNPAQVDHLLFCGANPAAKTAAGLLAIELVPACGAHSPAAIAELTEQATPGDSKQPAASHAASHAAPSPTPQLTTGSAAAVPSATWPAYMQAKQTQAHACYCMGAADQELWECRSNLARSLIAWRCLISPVTLGLLAWLHMLLLSILCLLGRWGCHTNICRPEIEHRVLVRRQQKQQQALARAQLLLSRMRTESQQGRNHLQVAKQEAAAAALAASSTAALQPAPEASASVGFHAASTSPGVGLVDSGSTSCALGPGGMQLSGSQTPGDTCLSARAHGFTAIGFPVHSARPALAVGGGKHATAVGLSAGQNNRPGGKQLGQVVSSSSSPPGGLVSSGGPDGDLVGAVASLSRAGKALPLVPLPTSIHDINVHLKESEAVDAQGQEQASEKAFKCFVRAVHALQNLDLQVEAHAAISQMNQISHASQPNQSQPAPVSQTSQPQQAQTSQPAEDQPGSAPMAVLAPAPSQTGDSQSNGAATSPANHTSQSLVVLEDEQAELYSCWAESVLLKFSRTCTCPGCAALAVQAVRMAHLQATRLYQCAAAKHGADSPSSKAVGVALARVVYVHICLLLETDAKASPTRASVWRADTCLREWERLHALGLLGAVKATEALQVNALQLWARTADSDLYIAEALLGAPLSASQSLQDVLAATVADTDAGLTYLLREISHEVVAQLDQAVTLALAPSPSLSALVETLADNSARELAAGARLREIIQGSRVPAGDTTANTLAMLTDAIRAAEPYPRLHAELATCYTLQEKWERRASALSRLEAVVDEVRHFTANHPLPSTTRTSQVSSRQLSQPGAVPSSGLQSTQAAQTNGAPAARSAAAAAAAVRPVKATAAPSDAAAKPPASHNGKTSAATGKASQAISLGSGHDRQQDGHAKAAAYPQSDSHAASAHDSTTGSSQEAAEEQSWVQQWDAQVKLLEVAIAEAKDANISVNKAKRLLKEMQAQAAGAEAARQLDVVLSKKQGGQGTLRQALVKAEAASSMLSSLGGAASCQGLTARIQTAKKRLDVERAAEVLSKATQACKAVNDLAKLEAAILAARKVGADDIDHEVYKVASETRARLHDASRARASMEAAQRALSKGQRPEDAAALDKAVAEAGRWEELLGPELSKAREALGAWHSHTAFEAKLTHALQHGPTIAALSRTITEAAAAGLKVGDAKRVLKLLQGVEQVLVASSQSTTSTAQLVLLRARLEAAEAGGVQPTFPLMAAAVKAVRRLSAASVREALEAALGAKERQGDEAGSPLQTLALLRRALEQAEALVGLDAISSVCLPTPAHPVLGETGTAAGAAGKAGQAGAAQAARAVASSSLANGSTSSIPAGSMAKSSKASKAEARRIAGQQQASSVMMAAVHASEQAGQILELELHSLVPPEGPVQGMQASGQPDLLHDLSARAVGGDDKPLGRQSAPPAAHTSQAATTATLTSPVSLSAVDAATPKGAPSSPVVPRRSLSSDGPTVAVAGAATNAKGPHNRRSHDSSAPCSDPMPAPVLSSATTEPPCSTDLPASVAGNGRQSSSSSVAAASAATAPSESLGRAPVSEPTTLTITEDDADMAMVLELARQAAAVLEADMQELARMEAERVAAEQERKERQERERAERAKQEQERQQRERQEVADQERLAGDKRGQPKARAAKGKGKSNRGTKLDLQALGTANLAAVFPLATPAPSPAPAGQGPLAEGPAAAPPTRSLASGWPAATRSSTTATVLAPAAAGGKTPSAPAPSSYANAAVGAVPHVGYKQAALAKGQASDAAGALAVPAAEACVVAVPSKPTPPAVGEPLPQPCAATAPADADVPAPCSAAPSSTARMQAPPDAGPRGWVEQEAAPPGPPQGRTAGASLLTDTPSWHSQLFGYAAGPPGSSPLPALPPLHMGTAGSAAAGRAIHVYHARGDSLDVLGDASLKLGRDVREALGLPDGIPEEQRAPPPCPSNSPAAARVHPRAAAFPRAMLVQGTPGMTADAAATVTATVTAKRLPPGCDAEPVPSSQWLEPAARSCAEQAAAAAEAEPAGHAQLHPGGMDWGAAGAVAQPGASVWGPPPTGLRSPLPGVSALGDLTGLHQRAFLPHTAVTASAPPTDSPGPAPAAGQSQTPGFLQTGWASAVQPGQAAAWPVSGMLAAAGEPLQQQHMPTGGLDASAGPDQQLQQTLGHGAGWALGSAVAPLAALALSAQASQRTSSVFSSATSAEELLHGAPHTMQHSVYGPRSGLPAHGTGPAWSVLAQPTPQLSAPAPAWPSLHLPDTLPGTSPPMAITPAVGSTGGPGVQASGGPLLRRALGAGSGSAAARGASGSAGMDAMHAASSLAVDLHTPDTPGPDLLHGMPGAGNLLWQPMAEPPAWVPVQKLGLQDLGSFSSQPRQAPAAQAGTGPSAAGESPQSSTASSSTASGLHTHPVQLLPAAGHGASDTRASDTTAARDGRAGAAAALMPHAASLGSAHDSTAGPAPPTLAQAGLGTANGARALPSGSAGLAGVSAAASQPGSAAWPGPMDDARASPSAGTGKARWLPRLGTRDLGGASWGAGWAPADTSSVAGNAGVPSIMSGGRTAGLAMHQNEGLGEDVERQHLAAAAVSGGAFRASLDLRDRSVNNMEGLGQGVLHRSMGEGAGGMQAQLAQLAAALRWGEAVLPAVGTSTGVAQQSCVNQGTGLLNHPALPDELTFASTLQAGAGSVMGPGPGAGSAMQY